MRAILVPAAFVLGLATVALGSTPAPAAGCLKGAVIGGVAGHYVGHHGLLGAGAGCLIGPTRPTSTPGSTPSASGRMSAGIKRDKRDMTAALRPAKEDYSAHWRSDPDGLFT